MFVRNHITSWWALVLRGLVSIVFGVLAIALAPMTLAAIFVLVGIWLVLQGSGTLVSGFAAAARGERRTFLMAEGVLTIAAGLVVWIWPHLTSVALLFVVAIWAVVIGIAQLSRAMRQRDAAHREWFRGLLGVASIALGILLFANPMVGAVAFAWLIGIYALVAGALDILIAFRLHAPRGHRRAIV